MNAIPAQVQTVLDLFTTILADVRFADVDGQTLARLAADVEAAAATVTAAQSQLDQAQAALQHGQDALLLQAQRALAYARVYAEHDEALSGRLEAVTLPRGARRPRTEDALVLSAEPQTAPRRRGRPRKESAEGTSEAPALESMALPAE